MEYCGSIVRGFSEQVPERFPDDEGGLTFCSAFSV
jgi:hypothetical protein